MTLSSMTDEMRKQHRHRLKVYPMASGAGMFVALERYVCIGMGGCTWIFLVGFSIPKMTITTKELWEQAWIHTGFFGEKVPES